MGTPLTGSSVASTYTGLLKNTDNSTAGASLKAISDGSGNDSALQISNAAVNTTGDFSVATNKLTVASASGNTAVAGTLGVTGATNLSSLATSGAATIGGALNVTGATTLTGNLTVPGNLAVTGTSTLTGATAVTGTLGVAGASTLASVGVTGAATVGTTLGVTGATTLASVGVTGNTTLTGDLAANGNTTLGNAGTDTLTLNSDNITVPNISTVTVDLAADKVLITDTSDSSKVKVVTASSLGISAATAPQVKQTLYQDSTAGASPFVATSTGSGTEITVLTTSITPRSTGSTVLVSIAINYSATTNIQFGVLRITRNGTEIGSNNIGSSLYGIAPFTGIGAYSSEFFSSQFIQILDSPASASAVTYKIHLYATGATFPSMWVNKTYQDVVSGSNSSSAARVSSSMILQEYFA